MLKRKTCCIVTGASQGLGACVIEHFVRVLSQDSVVIRLSRNTSKMEAATFPDKVVERIITEHYDQANINQKYFDSFLEDLFKKNNIQAADFQQAIMVHNAGSLGDVSKFTGEMSNAAVVQECVDVNVTGAVLLNSCFMKLFCDDSKCRRVIVNISSLAAIQPFKSWSTYCASKCMVKRY